MGYKRFVHGAVADKEPVPSLKAQREVYRRDGWHCRYCQIAVIDPEARCRLVRILNPLGSTLLWGRTDASRHAALLNLSASYDHVEPRSEAVVADKDNLVTPCWFCQFGKGGASLRRTRHW